MAVGVHPFPSRTRQLSPLAPTILGWKRPGKIGRRRLCGVFPTLYSSIAQSVEHAAVNRGVVGSSPTGGAKKASKLQGLLAFLFYQDAFLKANTHTEAGLNLIRDMRRRNPALGTVELWRRLRKRGYTRCPKSLFSSSAVYYIWCSYTSRPSRAMRRSGCIPPKGMV